MIARLESLHPYYIVAEPLYGLGFPPRRYVAQHFNCSSAIGGLGSCSYDSSIDAQCFVGPHVAGVRCTESKSFVLTSPLILQKLYALYYWYICP